LGSPTRRGNGREKWQRELNYEAVSQQAIDRKKTHEVNDLVLKGERGLTTVRANEDVVIERERDSRNREKRREYRLTGGLLNRKGDKGELRTRTCKETLETKRKLGAS